MKEQKEEPQPNKKQLKIKKSIMKELKNMPLNIKLNTDNLSMKQEKLKPQVLSMSQQKLKLL